MQGGRREKGREEREVQKKQRKAEQNIVLEKKFNYKRKMSRNSKSVFIEIY